MQRIIHISSQYFITNLIYSTHIFKMTRPIHQLFRLPTINDASQINLSKLDEFVNQLPL